jgi:sugar transferase (PEP-CTERM/EpsH1 system associated)
MKRLLYIAHRVPYPPDKGERVRAFHEICSLAKHFRVVLAALAHRRSDFESAKPLQEHCEEVLLAGAGGLPSLVRGGFSLLAGRSVTEGFFRSPALLKKIRASEMREPFDLTLAYCSSMLPAALATRAPARVIDLVDVDSAKWAGYAEAAPWPRQWLYHRESCAVASLERRAVETCNAVLLVSAAEAGALGATQPNVHAVANGVDSEFFRPGAVEPVDVGPAGLVFTGTMDYRPNAEGVEWFVRDVWPEVRKQRPDATFTVVGRNPTPAVRRLVAEPGVRVTGSVPDVRGYLEGASVSVCPLQIARGIQNKILEAMAMGKATVASSPALEGIETEVGVEVLRADSPQEWVRRLMELLDDVESRRQMGAAARRLVEQRYTWQARMAPLVSLCTKLCEGGRTVLQARPVDAPGS